MKLVLSLNILLGNPSDAFHRKTGFKNMGPNQFKTPAIERVLDSSSQRAHNTQARFTVAVQWFIAAILKINCNMYSLLVC
jgi:hypothetical protein